MKLNLFIIIIVNYIQSSSQQSDRINDGASISRDNPTRNEDLEECELIGIAESLIFKLIARDANEADLTEMVENNEGFKELEAFDKAVRSDFIDATYGTRRTTVLTRQRLRLKNFIIHVRSLILQKFRDVCTAHFRSQLMSRYDAERELIVVIENYLFSENQPCLCANDREHERERLILNSPFSPNNYLQFDQQFDLVYQLETHMNRQQVTELSVYHIIPIQLISQFFQIWLSDESTTVTDPDLNVCVITLFNRLKRSMRKLFLVNIIKLYGSSRIPIDVNSRTFFSEAVELTHGMLSGNIVLAPVNRGPFSPQFHRTGDELMNAIESNLEPIIGSLHHRDSLRLSQLLRDFNARASTWTPVTRFINGMSRFFTLYAALYQYDITTFNIEEWLLRRPTDEDLSNIPGMTEDLKEELKNQDFWDVKKPDGRSKRSVFEKSVNYLKQYFTRFILDTMEIHTTKSTQQKEFVWTCNFTCLLNDYRKLYSNKDKNDELCDSFSSYLYSTISARTDWRDCNNLKKFGPKPKWLNIMVK